MGTAPFFLAAIVLILLICSFVSPLSIDLSCPEEVNINQEFDCQVSVEDGIGIYDVKFEIKDGSETVAKAYNGSSWKSTYYYITNYLRDNEEKSVRLLITKKGLFDSVVKIRQDSKIESKNFTISVIEVEFGQSEPESSYTPQETVEEKKSTSKSSSSNRKLSKASVTINKLSEDLVEIKTISLNSAVILKSEDSNRFSLNSNRSYYPILALCGILILCGVYILKKL